MAILSPPERVTLNHYGLPLSALHWPGVGPTVLCFHGWLDQAANFEWIAQQVRHKADVWALDFRGHGHSGWVTGASYQFMDYLLDFDALYRHVGAEKVFVVGHSMGGMVSSYYIAAFPERVTAFINLEGIGPPDADFSQSTRTIRLWVEGYHGRLSPKPWPPVTLEQAADRLQKSVPTLPRERALHLAREGTQPVEGGLKWRFDRRHKERSPYRFTLVMARHIWASLKTPMIYVDGADSSFQGLGDARERVDLMNPQRWISLPGVGHHLPVEAPDEIADIVLKTLEEFGG